MTSRQAREARLQFIRQHPDLVGDGRKLAEAMQKAGLYSECTTPWQITKFLPSLLAELGMPGKGNASKGRGKTENRAAVDRETRTDEHQS
jgi:hypothetical protein